MTQKTLDAATALRALGAAAVLALLAAAPARAELVDWEVDETLSQVTLTVPDQVVTIGTITATIRLRNQSGGDLGPWNAGNVAAMGGTLATDYVDGTSIEFLSGQHLLFAASSGNYRPNPAAFDPLLVNAENPDGQFANMTAAPGAYGARVRASVSIITLDAAYINFTQAFYDILSSPLPITSGSFDGTELDLGFEQATIAFDGLSTLVGQPIPDAPGTLLLDVFAINQAAGGTVTSPGPDPDLRRLTIPVDVDLLVDVGGVPLAASATGTIVAVATVPEPGAVSMLASGAVLLICLDRRRRRRA